MEGVTEGGPVGVAISGLTLWAANRLAAMYLWNSNSCRCCADRAVSCDNWAWGEVGVPKDVVGVAYRSLIWAANAKEEEEGGTGTGAATRGGILFMLT